MSGDGQLTKANPLQKLALGSPQSFGRLLSLLAPRLGGAGIFFLIAQGSSVLAQELDTIGQLGFVSLQGNGHIGISIRNSVAFQGYHRRLGTASPALLLLPAL
jgi:hypothetical protein